MILLCWPETGYILPEKHTVNGRQKSVNTSSPKQKNNGELRAIARIFPRPVNYVCARKRNDRKHKKKSIPLKPLPGKGLTKCDKCPKECRKQIRPFVSEKIYYSCSNLQPLKYLQFGFKPTLSAFQKLNFRHAKRWLFYLITV